jgi:predicted Holliday junction resolvase-like endonuclease
LIRLLDIIIFDGFQERLNKEPLPQFTDVKTGSTFLVKENEEIWEALKRERVRFRIT